MARDNSYGIKEVADVSLYAVPKFITSISVVGTGDDARVSVLGGDQEGAVVEQITNEIAKFDSLKVSNIEVASEDTYAQGGKGNPKLIGWSYGKEVTFTMEDALISSQTLALWLGASESDPQQGRSLSDVSKTITVTAKSFPDTYLIIGKTFMRSYATGQDEPFFFVIPKAHIQVNGTVTMEAEGDPSTFEMTIDALAKNVGDDENVLVKFLQVGETPAFKATLSIATGSVSVNVSSVSGHANISKYDCLGDVTAAYNAGSVTITATENAEVGEKATVRCKNSNGDILAILHVTMAA